jgi:DNA-binding transcriptional regulator YhcF (GntR family)
VELMTKSQTSPESLSDNTSQNSASTNSYAVLRINANFLLDSVRRVRDFAGGDLLRNLIYLAIWLQCLSDVPQSATLHDDPEQKAITVREVADRLKVPYETVRRHANDLVRDGLCVRVKGHGIMIAPGRLKAMTRADLLAVEVARARALIAVLAEAGLRLEP